MKQPPAFQFYPSDFLSDENVVLMNNAEVGCYIKLLCFCWKQGSIPNNVNKIARLCNESEESMAQLWLAIGSCFRNGGGDGRLVHQRLEKERKKQLEFRQERSESGRKGAEIKWKKHRKKQGEGGDSSAIAKPIAEPMANDSSSSSSSNIYSSVVEFLNQKTNKKYKPTSRKTQTLIKTRQNEGFDLDDFKRVISTKSKNWMDTEYEKYLRPETLFSPKFESYLNESPPKEERIEEIDI